MNYYPVIAKHRNHIVWIFLVLHLLLAGLWVVAYRSIVLSVGNPRWFLHNHTEFAEIAIVLYILTTIPGIVRRFGKFYTPVAILMMFRRYIGITTFQFALLHASVVRFFPVIRGSMSLVPTFLFEYFGSLSFVMLFFLWITSNDWSVKRLGRWWHNIHNLNYIIGGVIFLHVSLQEVSIWSILLWFDAIALIASFVVSAKRKSLSSR